MPKSALGSGSGGGLQKGSLEKQKIGEQALQVAPTAQHCMIRWPQSASVMATPSMLEEHSLFDTDLAVAT